MKKVVQSFRVLKQGVRALWPAQSLSRLPMPVVKSMLQKNIRRGNAEAAVRCALELAIKSWSDAIRRSVLTRDARG